MEVQKEAQRIMTLSVWKMYHSRMQRGGLRLHRSLQLSLVMRSARELYLSAKVEAHEPPEVPSPVARSLDPRLHPPREAQAAAEAASADGEQPCPEPMDTQEAPKTEETPEKARLEEEGAEGGESAEVPERLQAPPAQAEGAFPNLARVLQRRFSGLLNCSPSAPPTAPPPPACAYPPTSKGSHETCTQGSSGQQQLILA
ncbi:PREDICTED: immediate early response gene 2 protein [Myotis davidii]|uniref:immediate early response gene 2 protein n=1 Tax=Myotis davidii TaxID=225400 RepID=UPI0003EBD0AE|nr:PREDICTED: immediate early response gene 2 protein [Myotis davidii]